MTGVHQVLATAVPGDAITNLALDLRHTLRRVSASEIYAIHVAPALQGDVRELRHYDAPHAHDVLLYHASIGEPRITAFLLRRPETAALVYHNITPSHYYSRWHPELAELLALGRRELADLDGRFALAMADSEFNADELRAWGYDSVRVVPPVVDAAGLTRLTPDPAMLHHLDEMVLGPIVLFVGQILPHKRPDLLLAAHHVLRTYRRPDANLFLVGPQRLDSYADALRRLVRELNLPGVHMTGAVSPEELAAVYRRARVFVTVSEHEGFCVPVLEAMAFDVPVVARDRAALGETVGDGGLLLPGNASSSLVAEGVAEVLDREDVHDALVARGRHRLARFGRDSARRGLLAGLLEVV